MKGFIEVRVSGVEKNEHLINIHYIISVKTTKNNLSEITLFGYDKIIVLHGIDDIKTKIKEAI